MRSHKVYFPKYDVPVRLRPWFLLFTSLVMILLAFLGFTNLSHSFPLNDKILHFFCLGFATGIFYFIFDVEEDARRIWFWRSSPLIFTGIICFFVGGIMSEFIQSLLPHKEFQVGDVAANLLGSSLGLYIAYQLERYYRHRREISRLYTPLDAEPVPSDDEGDVEATQLLPMHYQPSSSSSRNVKDGRGSKTDAGRIHLGNVWDEREELFDIGEDSDAEEEDRTARITPVPATPKIVVTSSES
ncbi:hypothetical protein SCP_0308640 [Sparassis crispa]|uniref:VanZ-like domain-containing protein n=1 Tax=Sparassis crispa TaxID=139825 RepID=A0A401GG32_9APHY|nr:hypothetical protein SCP_0308640 [Sparassis crispa]GBE81138.1 hypothetical protein SCP_0308640 [Sparassis crispa]